MYVTVRVCSCGEDTQSDYVEFSNFNVELMDRKMRRKCGKKSSNVRNFVESDGNFFRVTFKSNDAYDATGFEAFYQFRKYEGSFAIFHFACRIVNEKYKKCEIDAPENLYCFDRVCYRVR